MTTVTANPKTETTPKMPTTGSPSISAEDSTTGSPSGTFPILLRDLSEHSTEQAKQNWQTMKAANEKLAATVQDTCTTAAKESMDYGAKVMETAAANAQAALELAQALVNAKTPSEIIEISTAHARKQMEVMAIQNRQLWTVAQKVASSMWAPFKDRRDG